MRAHSSSAIRPATRGSGDTVSVSFWTGHPDSAPFRGAPYFEVQRADGADWITIVTEADWSTRARWTQAGRVIPPYDPLDPFATPPPPINEAFTVSIDWQIPDDAEPGTYRVRFHGSEKTEGSMPQPFVAETASFEVVSP
jgi:neutral ceramidase